MIIKSPADAAHVLRPFRLKRQEHFIVLTLRTSHEVIRRRTVAIGTLNKCIVHPRDVFFPAIKDNAQSIIIGHNHPSGDISPSPEDAEITRRMKEAGELLGISVLDHVIIAKKGFYSYLERGTL